MRGKLFGIGTGPGDPELLTLKAIRIMEMCDIIAVPSSESHDRTAFNIVEEYIKHKELIECKFTMDKDEQKRKDARVLVASEICKHLVQGENVGFITLGDPTVYSTYMYVHHLVKQEGFETEIISGIPSFVAVAAALNDSLCEGTEILSIIPASHHGNMEELLARSGNKVLMKSGRSLGNVITILKEQGLSEKVKIIERCGMENQRIFHTIKEFEEADEVSYFTIAIVKE